MKQNLYFLLVMLVMLTLVGLTSCEQKAFPYPDDPVKDSIDVYVKQAELGDAKSQSYAAYLLFEENTKADSARAIAFLERAVNANYPIAQNMLANLYRDSTDAKYNIKKAVVLNYTKKL